MQCRCVAVNHAIESLLDDRRKYTATHPLPESRLADARNRATTRCLVGAIRRFYHGKILIVHHGDKWGAASTDLLNAR